MNLNINFYMENVLVIILNFAGALSNDYYNTMTDKDDRIRIGRVLLGTITGTLISFVAIKRIASIREDNSLFLLFCYLVGIGGFKLFEWLRTVDIANTLLYILKIDTSRIHKADKPKDIKEDSQNHFNDKR